MITSSEILAWLQTLKTDRTHTHTHTHLTCVVKTVSQTTKGEITKEYFPVVADRLKMEINIAKNFTSMVTGRPVFRHGPKGPGPRAANFQGRHIKKKRLTYGMREKRLSTRVEFKGDLY
jgi:hypothetical protein